MGGRKVKFKLFWKIYTLIALVSVALVFGLSYLSNQVETKMSYIAEQHQLELQAYAEQARQLVGDQTGLKQWAESVKRKENTWLVVVKMQPKWLYGTGIPAHLKEDVTFGRLIVYPIHLHHEMNPVMDLPLGYQDYHLLIQLPERMRPGAYWQAIHFMITILLPLILVAVLSLIIYSHIIKPLQALHQDTIQFKQGDFTSRASITSANRHDELGQLSQSFNQMADNIAALINNQRQLIADISHELRTPMTRLRLLLDSKQQDPQLLTRVDREVRYMTGLVEDTLTLAWLENEKPNLNQEQVDLIALIESIAEDARFEFADHDLRLTLPEQCILQNSYHRALGQSIENIVRNAMKYSPKGSTVTIECWEDQQQVKIRITDQGSGVPESMLQEIFKPFFRVDKSRDRDSGGYGLGLALSKKQINAIGGDIIASNQQPQGLAMTIVLYQSA